MLTLIKTDGRTDVFVFLDQRIFRIFHFTIRNIILTRDPVTDASLGSNCNYKHSYANFSKIFITYIFSYLSFLNTFTSDHQTFCSFFKVRRHVIGCINHGIRPLLQATYEVILLHPSMIRENVFLLSWDQTKVLQNVSRQFYPWTRALTLLLKRMISLI